MIMPRFGELGDRLFLSAHLIAAEHRRHVDALIHDVRRQANLVVGIHIRQGDYREWNGGKYFYSIAEYATMMRRVQSDLAGRDVTFVVCGNTKLDRADFTGLNVRFGTGHLIEDMYALAETDLLIGPPSTFSGWASLWGNVPLQVLYTSDQEIDLSVMQASGDSADPYEKPDAGLTPPPDPRKTVPFSDAA